MLIFSFIVDHRHFFWWRRRFYYPSILLAIAVMFPWMADNPFYCTLMLMKSKKLKYSTSVIFFRWRVYSWTKFFQQCENIQIRNRTWNFLLYAWEENNKYKGNTESLAQTALVFKPANLDLNFSFMAIMLTTGLNGLRWK